MTEASQNAAPTTSRTQRRQERNRAAFVAAARRLFTRQGFEHTTIAEIAEEADLGFGTFYRYFEDKDAVRDAVIADARATVDALIQAPENDTAPPPEALAALTSRFVSAVWRDRDIVHLIGQMEPRRRPGFPVLLTEALRGIIERGMASGDFAAGDAALLARMVTAAHLSIIWPIIRDVDEEAVVAALRGFELRALGAPAAMSTSTPTPRANGRKSTIKTR